MGIEEPLPPSIAPDDSPFPLTDVDRWVLSQTDEEFKRHDWDELKEIIGKTSFDSGCIHNVCFMQGAKS
jgi:hypothetical protein